MTKTDPRKPTISAAVWAGVLLAGVVSTGALILAVSPDRQALGVATAPFGWNQVIVVHAFSALFLSWWLGRTLADWQPALAVRWKAPVWAGLGLAVAILTIIGGTAVQRALDGLHDGYAVRLLLRVGWCAVIQVPWCLAGLALARGPEPGWRPVFSSASLLGLAILTAVGVPESYLAVFLEPQTPRAQLYWQQDRLADARRLVQRLCDVGSTVSLGQRQVAGRGPVQITPQRARADLQHLLDGAQQQVDYLLSVDRSDQVSLRLAQCYLALDKPAEATAALQSLASRQPSAALMMAQIARSQDRAKDTAAWAAKALELTQQAKPVDAADALANEQLQMRACDLLVVLAGEAGDFETAERYLLEALDRLPTRSAEIHDRLGKHYEFVGEFPLALAHQRAAALQDPQNYAEPVSLLTKMLSTGAPVGLARPKASRYK